jgi:hypothetical protein
MITLTNTNQPLTPDTLASIPPTRAYTTIRADALIAALQQIASEWDSEYRLGQNCVTPAQMLRDFGNVLEGMGIENATALIMGYQLDQNITVTIPVTRRKKSRSNNTPPTHHAATIIHCNPNSQGLGE